MELAAERVALETVFQGLFAVIHGALQPFGWNALDAEPRRLEIESAADVGILAGSGRSDRAIRGAAGATFESERHLAHALGQGAHVEILETDVELAGDARAQGQESTARDLAHVQLGPQVRNSDTVVVPFPIERQRARLERGHRQIGCRAGTCRLD